MSAAAAMLEYGPNDEMAKIAAAPSGSHTCLYFLSLCMGNSCVSRDAARLGDADPWVEVSGFRRTGSRRTLLLRSPLARFLGRNHRLSFGLGLGCRRPCRCRHLSRGDELALGFVERACSLIVALALHARR